MDTTDSLATMSAVLGGEEEGGHPPTLDLQCLYEVKPRLVQQPGSYWDKAHSIATCGETKNLLYLFNVKFNSNSLTNFQSI